MTQETVFTNARLVTPDSVINGGSLAVRDGRIHAVDDRKANGAAIDLEGDFLVPGLVELHTDNMERHFMPRPGVRWPSSLAALLAHDAQVATSGITTVLDAVAIGEYKENDYRAEIVADSLAAVKHARTDGVTRADHLIHLRCEITDPCVVELVEPHIADDAVRLVSVMDHTPGQRQWRDIRAYATYYRLDPEKDRAEIEKELADREALQREYGHRHRQAITHLARERGVPLASHDDTDADHVAEAVRDGVSISEFPTTTDAARAARDAALTVIMGAPNVVRGGSHSGNVSAGELAELRLLDALSSDYCPASLLHAAFLLHERMGMPLPQALNTVTANPARMVGLDDRGALEPGRRADLLQVRLMDGVPVVAGVWRDGARVA